MLVQPCSSTHSELVELVHEHVVQFRYNHKGFTLLDWMKVFVPLIEVVQKYRIRENLV